MFEIDQINGKNKEIAIQLHSTRRSRDKGQNYYDHMIKDMRLVPPGVLSYHSKFLEDYLFSSINDDTNARSHTRGHLGILLFSI